MPSPLIAITIPSKAWVLSLPPSFILWVILILSPVPNWGLSLCFANSAMLFSENDILLHPKFTLKNLFFFQNYGDFSRQILTPVYLKRKIDFFLASFKNQCYQLISQIFDKYLLHPF